MYTQCPSCSTLFRVNTRYLREAGGRVRCCLCHETFDAMASLAERLPEGVPQAQVAKPEPVAGGEAVCPPPAGDRQQPDGAEPESESLARLEERRVPAEPEPADEGGELALEAAASTAGDEAQSPGKAAVDAAVTEALPAPARPTAAGGSDDERDLFLDIQFDPLPELESEPVATVRRRAGIGGIGWAAAILLLIAALLLQYAYVARNELAQEPRLRPWLETLCRVAGCELPLRRDLAQVQILQRRVAAHPSMQGALLVSATISNEASFSQPFPELRLSFLDANGREQGARWFMPQEYLEDPLQQAEIAAGMPSKQPIAVRLEVLDPGRAAENFEISFR